MSGYLFKGFIYPVQNKHHSGDCIKATFSNQGTLFPFPSNIFFLGGGREEVVFISPVGQVQ